MAKVDAPPDAPAIEPTETESVPRSGRRFVLLAVPLLVAVVVVAAYIGINVLSVLFAVVSPPLPPIPPNVTQTSHENTAYGVDYWRYTSSEDGCVLVRYLEENGGVCQLAPAQCAAPQGQQGMVAMDGIVARCEGRQDFSIFTLTWRGVVIREAPGRTQLQLDREVYWIGTGPQ